MAKKLIPPMPPLPSIEQIIANTADLTYATQSNAPSIVTAALTDFIFAGAGANTVNSGAGSDIVVDRGGSDKVTLGAGDDVFIYDAGLNTGARDTVSAGAGADTLVLNLTAQEWLGTALQADMARIVAQMGTAAASGATLGSFRFSAFNLATNGFDAVRVFVDGQELTVGNDTVTAVADQAAVLEGSTVSGNLLANDSVADLVAAVNVVTPPTEGALTLAADGSFSFDATTGFEWLAAGQTHDVSFVYRVTDANGDSALATATVTITGTNDLPVITGTLSGATVENSPTVVSGQLTGTDADAADTLVFAGSAAGTYGNLTVDAQGAWTYTLGKNWLAAEKLAEGQVANEVFTITATDSTGAVVSQDITIAVTGTNDAPTLAGVNHGSVGNVAAMQKAMGQLYRGDIDGDALTLTSSGTATYGTFAIDATGAWTYQLDPTSAAYQALATGATVTETFNVQVDDGHGGIAVRAISVDVVGLSPAPGAMTIDMTHLADFAGLMMAPTITGTMVLTNNQRQQIVTPGPVSDFNILFSTDFLTGGSFNTPLTPNAHLHLVANNTVFGANVVTLAASGLVTDVFTGMGNDLISARTSTATGSTFDAGTGTDIFEINSLLLTPNQSVDASALFTTGAIAINGVADAWHATAFEMFRYTGVNQTLTATDHADILIDRGQNTIFGGGGNDAFTSARVGTAGAHSELYGGDGNDQFLSQGAATSRDGDIIDGGAGTDSLTLWNILSFDASASTSFDVLTQGGTVHVAGMENLIMNGSADANTLIAGAGNDVVNGLFGDDLIQGGAGNDVLDGGYGNDTLAGDGGNNTLYGGVGDDLLTSFLGNDLVNGSYGNDTITLGAADAFSANVVISGIGIGDGMDAITNFNAEAGTGHDVLSFNSLLGADGLSINSLDRVLAASTQTVDGVAMDFGGGNGLVLHGVSLAQLTVDDFLFA